VKVEPGIGPENTARKRAGVTNKDVVVFAFFLLLSFLFWFINSLGKEIESDIRYEVEYVNPPEKRVVASGSRPDIFLFVKGTGYSVLKLKFSRRKPPVEIDISKVSYKRVSARNPVEYYIVTSGLIKNLKVHLRSGCEVTAIKPDTLFFSLDREKTDSLKGVRADMHTPVSDR
jgi:hypothetical protein